MEIKLGDRTYFVPDVCDSNNRRKAALRGCVRNRTQAGLSLLSMRWIMAI